MFKRQKTKGANRELGLESTMAASETRPLDATAGPTSAAATSEQPFGGAAAGSGGTTMLPPSMAAAPPLGATAGGQGGESAMEVTGEYLTQYLKEMDGDDSQFQDISSSVVPLSTGTSPPRQPPHEFLLRAEADGGNAAKAGTGARPSSALGGGAAGGSKVVDAHDASASA